MTQPINPVDWHVFNDNNGGNTCFLKPADLGFDPERFPAFRECQLEALEWVQEQFRDGVRFVGAALPTGSGKSLVAQALGRLMQLRTVTLTATRGLQEQYASSFAPRLVDIRGKANYECRDCPYTSCRWGALEGCRAIKQQGCTYEQQRERARLSMEVSGNYAYWIKANRYTRGLEPKRQDMESGKGRKVEMLVLDEAHAAQNELSRSMQIVLREQSVLKFGIRDYPKGTELVEGWSAWALGARARVEEQIEQITEKVRSLLLLGKAGAKYLADMHQVRSTLAAAEDLLESLESISLMNEQDWVCEQREGTQHGRVWEFNCAWPGAFAESRLFVGVPKVVLLSGSLRRQHMGILNIKKEESAFREWPRVFPAKNTPIYHIRTVKMRHEHKQSAARIEQFTRMVDRVDEIIESRLPRNFLIQTVSFDRQQWIWEHSRFKDRFFGNTDDPESESATEEADKFKKSPMQGKGLVSPSFGTGWNFPGEEVRFIIVVKLPFPAFKSKVMQARLKRNARYTDYICAQDLEQMVGRGTRSEEDWCEVFIIDDALTYFMFKAGTLFSSNFQVIKVNEVPPMRLGVR